jgi:hypothetical protein
MFIYSVKVQGRSYPWARLVYQFIKLCAEVYTFTVSRDYPYVRDRDSQNTSKVSRQENTMKPFKGSSNKLGPLGFQSQSVWFYHAGIHSLLFPICATRVTSNKLEKVLILS